MSNPLSAMTDDRGGRHAKISNRWLCNTTSRSLMLPIEQGINPGQETSVRLILCFIHCLTCIPSMYMTCKYVNRARINK